MAIDRFGCRQPNDGSALLTAPRRWIISMVRLTSISAPSGRGATPTESSDIPPSKLLDQRGAVHSQQLGRAVLVAARSCESLSDQAILQLGEQSAQIHP